MGVAPPTASHWALRPRPLTCRRHCTSFSGNAQADNIFRTLFANKRIHIWGGPNPPLALPGADSQGLLTDAQYAVCFALFFGLPCKAISPDTTCVRTCARAAKAGEPDLLERGWFFGHHFFHCGAGSRLEGVTNLLGRHDALARTLGNCFSELGFTVCSDKRAQQYALTLMGVRSMSMCPSRTSRAMPAPKPSISP